MKRIIVLVFSLHYLNILFSQSAFPDVVLETTFGNLVIHLYSETPLHSNNFVKLVREGYYDGQLFHRVIENFMIQTGDPNSKNAKSGQLLGTGGPPYTIHAEFNAAYYHKRGAVAAARQPDNINPKKESSGSQFYIVQGKKFTKEELELLLQRGAHLPFTQEEFEIYTTIGGSPHLDNEYTVFGELIDGFDVLDLIAHTPVDKKTNRPLQDVKIIRAYLLK